MKSARKAVLRQMMDWRAAIIAGIVAGMVYLVMNMWLASEYLGNANVPLQLPAALVMGTSVLPPAEGIASGTYLTGFLIHMSVSVLFTCVIAFCLYRWGIWIGILGGALFGLALYSISYYGIALWLPWLSPMRGWIMAVSHVVYGAVAGGVYEALERDPPYVNRFKPVPH
jgi:hypothetical protein